MEGNTRPRQRAPRVLRAFKPMRLQDDLLAAVYDRLLEVGARVVESVQNDLREPQLERVPAVQRQLAKTGG
jgi:hypothetical protein